MLQLWNFQAFVVLLTALKRTFHNKTFKVGLKRTTVQYLDNIVKQYYYRPTSFRCPIYSPSNCDDVGCAFFKMIYEINDMCFFFLPAGTGLYSNKPHYHLLFVVSVFTHCSNTKSERAMSFPALFSISITAMKKKIMAGFYNQ